MSPINLRLFPLRVKDFLISEFRKFGSSVTSSIRNSTVLIQMFSIHFYSPRAGLENFPVLQIILKVLDSTGNTHVYMNPSIQGVPKILDNTCTPYELCFIFFPPDVLLHTFRIKKLIHELYEQTCFLVNP